MDIFDEQLSLPPTSQLILKDISLEEKWCIVCCSKVKSNRKNEFVNGPNLNANGYCLIPALERNLDVVFLLRNLMKVPGNQLEKDLEEFGENPEDWISLCNKCTQLTRQARKMYQEILRIDKEFKSIQEFIIFKTRSSSKKSPMSKSLNNPSDKMHHQNVLKTEEIWRKTRAFVKNYGYPITTTNQSAELFTEGDKLANYLANQLKTSSFATSTILIPNNLKDDISTVDSTTASTEIKMEVESILPDNYLDNPEDTQVNWEPEPGPETDLIINHRITNHKATVKKRRPPSVYTSKRQYKHYEIIDGKYKCRHCDELFFSGSTCYVHEREKHPKIPGQYGCDICGRRFNSSAYLITHRNGVHKVKQTRAPPKQEEKPIKCDLCGKVFKLRKYLRQHKNETVCSNSMENEGDNG